MQLLAIIILVLFVVQTFTPGSMFKTKPVIDFESPKFWMSIANTFFCIALALFVAF